MSRPQPLLLVVDGASDAAGSLCELAGRLMTFAIRAGFRRVRVEVSRVPGSGSRYLYATDAAGREWKLRLSRHRRPTDASIPHLDIRTLDGSGYAEASHFLMAAAAGERAWFDVKGTGRAIAPRQRRMWDRR